TSTSRVKGDDRTLLAVGAPDPQRTRAHEMEQAAIGGPGTRDASGQRRGRDVRPASQRDYHAPLCWRSTPQRNSVVEGQLPKFDVARSTPGARSLSFRR